MRRDGHAGSRERLLLLLKTRGPQSAAWLARRLGLTTMAVRQQLQRLLDGGLVAFDERRGTVGRPARIWRLRERAEGQFPEGSAALALELLSATAAAFGGRGLQQLLRLRTRAQVERYRSRLPGPERPLSRRIAALARLRRGEGYLAESSGARDGMVLLVENHCPICVAARACQGLCGAELDLFREVLGPGVTVEREEHILAGDRRCAYRFGVLPGR